MPERMQSGRELLISAGLLPPNATAADLGKLVGDILYRTRLSQTALGRRIGCGQSSVSAWLHGEGWPAANNAQGLIDLLRTLDPPATPRPPDLRSRLDIYLARRPGIARQLGPEGIRWLLDQLAADADTGAIEQTIHRYLEARRICDDIVDLSHDGRRLRLARRLIEALADD